MCGIVAYFGGAGNHLTRVLTGMSAIIYRAPDSTGIGFFGDEVEPIRARKSLGSVGELIKALVTESAYPNRAAMVASIWKPGTESEALVERQQALLRLEGFTEETVMRAADPAFRPPSFDDLVDLVHRPAVRIRPGDAGTAAPLPVYRVESPMHIHDFVHALIQDYDLSPVAIQQLYREALKVTLADTSRRPNHSASDEDLLTLFDQMMERMMALETAPSAASPAGDVLRQHEHWVFLWQELTQCPMVIPTDYDRDGVRCVFRLMDSALLSHLPSTPELRERLDALFFRLWPGAKAFAPLDWHHWYSMEKAANVFGRAASAALTFLQSEAGLLPPADDEADADVSPDAIEAGVTDPVSLRFHATPILAHGRWALQSPVTIRNSHPFLDETRQRAIVVNGQFDTELENRVKTYLRQVAGLTMRTENSGEYFALLWGDYFRQLQEAQRHYDTVRTQTERGLGSLGIGSQAIDYQIYYQVRDRSPADLDELAFRQAVRQMSQSGGQIAVAGISLVSPRRIYLAGHNRPVFVVRRLDNNDVMVVSDINAAIGLFPQKTIHRCSQELLHARRELELKVRALLEDDAPRSAILEAKGEHLQKEKDICQVFEVEVYPLEGENQFARIETVLDDDNVSREILLSTLDETPITDRDPMTTRLRPALVRSDLYASFFEMHLKEVPDRLEDILQVSGAEETGRPRLDLNHKLLERRFGTNFNKLARVVIVGTGSSYHVTLMARTLFRRYLPHLATIAFKPSEIEPEDRFINPEADLVVLVSWSSTSADMVELAKALTRRNVVMIGITEKPYADMALVVAKSGGVLLSMSGEEVTVAAVKSTFCLLFCLSGLAAWLAAEIGHHETARKITKAMTGLPERLRSLIGNPELVAFTNKVTEGGPGITHWLVLHGADDVGVAREAALKLVENDWVTVGKALDFQDVEPQLTPAWFEGGRVLVHATSRRFFKAALQVMEKLSAQDLAFTVITYANRELEQIDRFSREHHFELPKIEDAFQPFIDLVFYYELAHRSGLTHGKAQSDFPRNRTKSVTAGRSRKPTIPSPTSVVAAITGSLPDPPPSGWLPPGAQPMPDALTAWERDASLDPERAYYHEVRRLASRCHGWAEESGGAGFEFMDPVAFSRLVFDEVPPDGHLILMPCDRTAEIAALNAAAQWHPLLPCGMRVERCGLRPGRIPDSSVLIVCASRPPEDERIIRFLEGVHGPRLWIGPDPGDAVAHGFLAATGMLFLPGADEAEGAPEAVADALYLSLCRLFIEAWRVRRPARGQALARLMEHLPPLVETLLDDGRLNQNITRSLVDDRAYATAFYVGPPGGSGLFWEDACARLGGMVTVSYTFGECAHGPLVTVDPRMAKKYVFIDRRHIMAEVHGEHMVAQWERQFLAGRTFGDFLAAVSVSSAPSPAPFFAEGYWYLPVLRDDYDASEDNLIFFDATSPLHFNSALDELSTFGCRFARLTVLTQSAFDRQPEVAALYGQPISHFLKIPALAESEQFVPDLLLPVVRNLLGMAIAVATRSHRATQPTPDATPSTA